MIGASNPHFFRFGFTTIFYIVLAAGAPRVHAQDAPAVSVTVSGMKTTDGNILAAVYDEASWGKGKAVAVGRASAGAAIVTLELKLPATGRYAVRLFHDIDGDGKMATNLLGIPSEPFGFSNNAAPSFGPPAFADAAFEVTAAGVTQNILLR